MKTNHLVILSLAAALAAVSCAEKTAPALESNDFTLEPGERATLGLTYLRKNVDLKASMSSDSPITHISLGRGDAATYWMARAEVTVDSVFIYEQDFGENGPREQRFESFAHGLELGKALDMEIVATAPDSTGILTLKTPQGNFERKIRWRGGGRPYLLNQGSAPMEATLSFVRGDVGEDIWFIADSYWCEYDIERWPTFMVEDGHLHWLAEHLPGGGSAEMLDCFIRDLDYGTPKIAVWMMGMNDYNDGPDRPNLSWQAATETFISVCLSKGITPVLTTIPTVPGRCHDHKTSWVRASGFRYIDWYTAVGAQPWDGSPEDVACVAGTGAHRGWTEGYLYVDQVHPTEPGARALCAQVYKDLPEILEK